MSHTPGPLTVRISDKWPFAIETVNAGGEVVFTDGMPCHSSKDKTVQDAIDCVHFRFSEREQYSEMNKRAIADAVLRAAAPELLAVAQMLIDGGANAEVFSAARAAIAKATGEPQ